MPLCDRVIACLLLISVRLESTAYSASEIAFFYLVLISRREAEKQRSREGKRGVEYLGEGDRTLLNLQKLFENHE
jgi:hypothetical protein